MVLMLLHYSLVLVVQTFVEFLEIFQIVQTIFYLSEQEETNIDHLMIKKNILFNFHLRFLICFKMYGMANI